MMTTVVSSFRIKPPRRCSSTQASHSDESNARRVFQGFSPTALLARNQQARASDARMKRSPGAHSPLCRRTLPTTPLRWPGCCTPGRDCYRTGRGLPGERTATADRRGRQKGSYPLRPPPARRAAGSCPARHLWSAPTGSRTPPPSPSPLRATVCGPTGRRRATPLAPTQASPGGNPQSDRRGLVAGRRRPLLGFSPIP